MNLRYRRFLLHAGISIARAGRQRGVASQWSRKMTEHIFYVFVVSTTVLVVIDTLHYVQKVEPGFVVATFTLNI